MITRLVLGSAFVLSFWATAASAETLKMSGAAVTFNGVVQPAKEAVEKATGTTLMVISSASTKGLADLIDGTVDIAMISEPQEALAASAESVGKKLDTAAVRYFLLATEEISFVVHPSNPVSS